MRTWGRRYRRYRKATISTASARCGDPGGVYRRGTVRNGDVRNLGDPIVSRDNCVPSTPTEWCETLGERKHCWKSDPLIVLGARESRAHGEAAGPESTCSRDTFAILRDGERMKTKLDRIAEKAKTDGKLRFTALVHLLTPERWLSSLPI